MFCEFCGHRKSLIDSDTFDTETGVRLREWQCCNPWCPEEGGMGVLFLAILVVGMFIILWSIL